MRRALSLALLLALAALPVAGQIVNGRGGVVVNGVLQGSLAGASQVMPDGTLVFGDVAVSPVCELTGVTVTSINDHTTTLTKTAHGCSLYQGDIVVVTGSADPLNLGAYIYTGIETLAPNTIEIGSCLHSTETATMSLSIFRGAWIIDPDGKTLSMTELDGSADTARYIAYRLNMTSGESKGLTIFFGGDYYGAGFGTAGAEGHFPITAYRYFHRGGTIFSVNGVGDVQSGASIAATGGAVSASNLVASSPSTPAAPTIAAYVNGVLNDGSTTWSYVVVPRQRDGSLGPASAVGTTTHGASDLSGGVSWNTLTIGYQAGVYSWDVRRTVVGTSPATTGLIGNVIAPLSATASAYFTDTGFAGDGTATPTDVTTGIMRADGIKITEHVREFYIDKTLDGDNTATQVFEVALNRGDMLAIAGIVGKLQAWATDGGTPQQLGNSMIFLRLNANRENDDTQACSATGNANYDPAGTAFNSVAVACDVATTGLVKLSWTLDSQLTAAPVNVGVRGTLVMTCSNDCATNTVTLK